MARADAWILWLRLDLRERVMSMQSGVEQGRCAGRIVNLPPRRKLIGHLALGAILIQHRQLDLIAGIKLVDEPRQKGARDEIRAFAIHRGDNMTSAQAAL